MLTFLGQLMGSAIRTKIYLDINMPTLFWKQLTGEPLTKTNLEHCDKMAVKYLDDITNAAKKGISKENFEDFFDESFTTYLSNGEQVELVADGKKKRVTYDNRLEYVDLVLKKRLEESQLQAMAIRKGLVQNIPLPILNIWSAKELEVAVCGEPIIDVELLKKNTRYQGSYSEKTPVIANFWKLFNEYDNYHRVLYLRFAWGRSRLPLCSDDFDNKHEITLLGKSHTQLP